MHNEYLTMYKARICILCIIKVSGIYIYIYVVAVLLHIESRCRLDLRNNSLHHFIIHRNLRLNSSKSN